MKISELVFGLGALIVIAPLVVYFPRRYIVTVADRRPESILDEVGVLTACGRIEEAIALLEKARARFPGNAEISSRLSRLK